jgi:hypothetical protein
MPINALTATRHAIPTVGSLNRNLVSRSHVRVCSPTGDSPLVAVDRRLVEIQLWIHRDRACRDVGFAPDMLTPPMTGLGRLLPSEVLGPA